MAQKPDSIIDADIQGFPALDHRSGNLFEFDPTFAGNERRPDSDGILRDAEAKLDPAYTNLLNGTEASGSITIEGKEGNWAREPDGSVVITYPQPARQLPGMPKEAPDPDLYPVETVRKNESGFQIVKNEYGDIQQTERQYDKDGLLSRRIIRVGSEGDLTIEDFDKGRPTHFNYNHDVLVPADPRVKLGEEPELVRYCEYHGITFDDKGRILLKTMDDDQALDSLKHTVRERLDDGSYHWKVDITNHKTGRPPSESGDFIEKNNVITRGTWQTVDETGKVETDHYLNGAWLSQAPTRRIVNFGNVSIPVEVTGNHSIENLHRAITDAVEHMGGLDFTSAKDTKATSSLISNLPKTDSLKKAGDSLPGSDKPSLHR